MMGKRLVKHNIKTKKTFVLLLYVGKKKKFHTRMFLRWLSIKLKLIQELKKKKKKRRCL